MRKSNQKKQIVTIYLDKSVVKYFKKGGRGYQGRINSALKEHIGFLSEKTLLNDLKRSDTGLLEQARIGFTSEPNNGKVEYELNKKNKLSLFTKLKSLIGFK